MKYSYPFTEFDMQAAADTWGCNCGPSALAFARQVGLDHVRGNIPGFEDRRYTSPTMMKQALAAMGARFVAAEPDRKNLFHPSIALVRVQWTGPWAQPGANPKWAYRQTHWIATWQERAQPNSDANLVFDCNGGVQPFGLWERDIVPLLTGQYPRADGGWFPAQIWRMDG